MTPEQLTDARTQAEALGFTNCDIDPDGAVFWVEEIGGRTCAMMLSPDAMLWC